MDDFHRVLLSFAHETSGKNDGEQLSKKASELSSSFSAHTFIPAPTSSALHASIRMTSLAHDEHHRARAHHPPPRHGRMCGRIATEIGRASCRDGDAHRVADGRLNGP